MLGFEIFERTDGLVCTDFFILTRPSIHHITSWLHINPRRRRGRAYQIRETLCAPGHIDKCVGIELRLRCTAPGSLAFAVIMALISTAFLGTTGF